MSPFIREISTDTAGFTSAERAAWTTLGESATVESIRLVSVNSLPGQLDGDHLTFRLPGTSDTLRVRGLYLQKSGDTSYTWWGELPSAAGYVGIAANGAGKLMTVSTTTARYMIYPLSSRYNALVELVPDTVSWVCAVDNDSLPEGPSCEIDTCKNIVTALVLVTPEAIDEAMGFNPDPAYEALYFALGEQTINYALINSSVIGKSFRFVTEVFEGFYFDPNNSIFIDLNTLRLNTPDAWDRFATNQADVLILLTDSRYNSYFGIEEGQPPTAIVIESAFFSPNWTFAHEIGHMLDAGHSRVSQGGDVPDNQSGCNTGYRVNIPGVGYRFTIMAVIDEGETRIPYYSNPNISYYGVPIGGTKSYNAAHITNTICGVADEYFAEDELKISISGPAPVCNQAGTYTISIDPPGTGIPGNSPYTYKWYLGAQPYTNPLAGTLIGSSSSVTITPTSALTDKYWLYASVHSADGVMANALRKFDNPCFEAEEKSGPVAANARFFDLICQPNPAIDHLNIIFSPESKNLGTYSYRILAPTGQVEKSGLLHLDKDVDGYQIEFDLTNGLYFLEVRHEGLIVAQKFIVNH